MSRRPRVAVVGTGGTVSFVGRHPLDLYEYADGGKLLGGLADGRLIGGRRTAPEVLRRPAC